MPYDAVGGQVRVFYGIDGMRSASSDELLAILSSCLRQVSINYLSVQVQYLLQRIKRL